MKLQIPLRNIALFSCLNTKMAWQCFKPLSAEAGEQKQATGVCIYKLCINQY